MIAMSSSITPASLLSQASSNAKNSAASASASSQTTGDSSSAGALASLSGNFNQFLSLLTAQLQHQDPSNPTNTDNFTSEIAQFAGVQQQAETNTNLGTLISATQSNEMTSALNLIGRTTSAATSILPLQNGQATVSYTAPQAGNVAIAVSGPSGAIVKTASVPAQVGLNNWVWDGTSDEGVKLPDGQYNIGIEGTAGTSAVALAPTVSGTVTGISKTASGVKVNIGNAAVDMNTLSTFSGM